MIPIQFLYIQREKNQLQVILFNTMTSISKPYVILRLYSYCTCTPPSFVIIMCYYTPRDIRMCIYQSLRTQYCTVLYCRYETALIICRRIIAYERALLLLLETELSQLPMTCQTSLLAILEAKLREEKNDKFWFLSDSRKNRGIDWCRMNSFFLFENRIERVELKQNCILIF